VWLYCSARTNTMGDSNDSCARLVIVHSCTHAYVHMYVIMCVYMCCAYAQDVLVLFVFSGSLFLCRGVGRSCGLGTVWLWEVGGCVEERV
jgi:hypothetical protein